MRQEFRRTITVNATLLALSIGGASKGVAGSSVPLQGVQSAEFDLAISYRTDWTLNDNKNRGSEGYHPRATFDLDPYVFRLMGSLARGPGVKAEFSLSTVDPQVLEKGIVVVGLSESLTLHLGKQRVRQGGFEGETWDVSTFAVPIYHQYLLPFQPSLGKAEYGYGPYYQAAGAVSIHSKHNELIVQALEDLKQGEDAASIQSRGTQPAMIFEWHYRLGGLESLVQIGSYDVRRGAYTAFGVRYQSDSYVARIEYMTDSRERLEGADKKRIHLVMHILDCEQRLASWRSGLKYSDTSTSRTGLIGAGKVMNNSPGAEFDHNAREFATRVSYTLHGGAFVPFLGVVARSGKFEDPLGPSNEAKIKTQISYKLGAFGLL